MSKPRRNFRAILARPECTLAAPIYDPLSARVAEMGGWEVAKLSGSLAKLANLAVPDNLMLSNVTDLAALCGRIANVSNMPLIVDADDGGSSALSVFRTVRDLEAAGVSAIEIDDKNSSFMADGSGTSQASGRRDATLIPISEQVGKLQAAVAARRDPETVIVARTNAFASLSTQQALLRIKAYSQTGAEALMLEGVPGGMEDVRLTRQVTQLPLCVLGLPDDDCNDVDLLVANGIRIRFAGHVVFRMVLKTLHDGFKHLKDGHHASALAPQMAPERLVIDVSRREQFERWLEQFESFER